MNASQFDDQLNTSNAVHFVYADMLARPWLVHARLRLVFAALHGDGYVLRSSPTPRRTCAPPSSARSMQHAV